MDDTTIDFDVRCTACGYNLRALSVNGKCPECGTGTGQTLLDRARNADSRIAGSRPDEHVLRQAIDGAVLLMLAFVITLVLALVPVEWFRGKPPGQIFYPMAAQCVAWGMICYGFWKFGAAPRSLAESNFSSERAVCMILRGVAIALLAWPIVLEIQAKAPNFLRSKSGMFLINHGMVVTLLCAGPALMFRVRELSRGLGLTRLAGLATVLACLSAATATQVRSHDIPWLLGVAYISIPPLGSLQLWRRVAVAMLNGHPYDDSILNMWLPIGTSLLSMSVLAAFWFSAGARCAAFRTTIR